MKHIIGLVVGLCFLMQTMAQDYDVSVRGMGAGKAKLNITSDGTSYQAILKLYPNLLASLAGVGNWVDSSKGKIIQGHFQPSVYQRTDGKKRLLSVKFVGEQAQVNNDDGSKTLSISSIGQDPMSQIAQIQYDLKADQLSPSYYLVTDNNQRLYYSRLVKTGGTTQVILSQEKGGDRTIILWFDANLQLIRMKKTKRGKVDFDMTKR